MSRGVLGRKKCTNTWSLKNEDGRQDVQLKKKLGQNVFY